MASRIVHSNRTSIWTKSVASPLASRFQFGLPVTRRTRGMAFSAHAQKPKSDTAWIIGSSLVFGPALIYLLGPRSTGAVTSHGDAHPSKHGPASTPFTKTDVVNQTDETVEVKAEAVSDLTDVDALPKTEDDDPKAEDTSSAPKVLEASTEDDATQSGEVGKIDAVGPNQDDVKDAIRQDV